MAENNKKDNTPFSFVGVATEGMNMKEEKKRMLERKGKINSSVNPLEQEKDIYSESVDIKKKETGYTHTRFSENLTPSLSNEGGEIEKSKNKKLRSRKGNKENLCEVRISLFLPEKDMRILRVYLSSNANGEKKSVTSFVTSLVVSKLKSIRKELTEQGIKALLGIEDKE